MHATVSVSLSSTLKFISRVSRHLTLVCLLLGTHAGAMNALGQNLTDISQMAAMERQYGRQKDSGDWKAAGQTSRQMFAYAQQRRMSPIFQISAIDYTALVELNLGNHEDALKLYQKVVLECNRYQPEKPSYGKYIQQTHFNGYQGVARCYREANQTEKAAEAFQVAIKYAKSVGQPSWAAAAGADRGHLLLQQSMVKEALKQFREVLPVLQQTAQRRGSNSVDKSHYANALQGMALAYMNLGEYNKAEPLARSAVAWSESAVGRNSTFRATALKVLALIYSYQNRQADTIPIYEECVRIYRVHQLEATPQCLGIMNNLSSKYVLNGQPEKGIEMAELVLKKQEELSGPDNLNLIVPLTNLGNVYLQVNQYDKAARHLERAMKLSEKHLPPNHRQTIETFQLYASNELSRGGDKVRILGLLNKVLKMYQSVPSRPGDLAGFYTIRSIVYRKMGEQEKALADMEECLKYAEQQRTLAAGGERERAKLFEHYALSYGRLMAWNVEKGAEGLDEAFGIAETMKARSFMDALHTANFDLLRDLPEEERARFQVEEKQMRDALTTAEQQYDSLPADASQKEKQKAAYAVYVARDRLYEHMVSVENASATHRQLISDGNHAASLDTVKKELLGPKELMLSYAVYGDRTFVFSVRQDSARVTEIKVNEDQGKVLGVQAGNLGRPDLSSIFLGDEGLLSALSRPKESPTLNARLAALWEILVPEEDRKTMLDGSLEVVTILPDGLLALLPFEALVVNIDNDTPEYLLDQGPPLNYAPSASVMMNLAQRPAYEKNGDREPVLTLGDPDYGQVASADGRAAQLRAKLSRLPFSGNEATWVSQHFKQQGIPSVKLTRGQATEAQVRKMVSGREIVHLACHGMAENQYGNFFGCLALAPGRKGDANDDGFLYTPEIYKLNLKGCELAILSACETNFGPQQTGEGVWTLSRGFLVSGARRVLASNWVVNDAAGATLVSYFAHELAKPTEDSRRRYAAGLQKAKQSLRKQEQWSHPFYWSGLVLVGPN